MKEVFKRLPQEKQDRVLAAFLMEFSQNDYEGASITSVVKDLGIAKGSVYQYFGSKMELYQMLWEQAGEAKAQAAEGLNPDDFWDFWDWYREVCIAGLNFDLEHLDQGNLLYRAAQDRSNPDVAELMRGAEQKELARFKELVEREQENGLITREFDAEFVARVIVSETRALRKCVQAQADSEDAATKCVDQTIALFKKAFSV